jgi:excinuclease ABC subunit C
MEPEKVIEGVPDSPGVYIMKDSQGHVIYVGKAINIRKRVLSHFRNLDNFKDSTLSSSTEKVEFVVTPTETEALLLENNLIKKFKPRYNIRLRDDKTYPFIKLSLAEKFPCVSTVRRIIDDGSTYFGPMGDVGGAKATLKMVRKLFPVRNCTRTILKDGKKERPCLEYQLKQCSAPCAGLVSEQDYRGLVDGIRRILSGDQEALIDEFKRKMEEASEKLEFEKAALCRDRIRDLERTTLKQVMVLSSKISRDVLAVAKKGNDACIQLLVIRGGKLIDQAHFPLEGVGGSSDKEAFSAFINQHYHQHAPSSIPAEIMTPENLEDKSLLEESLSEGRRRIPEYSNSAKVKLVVPVNDEDLKLIEMAKDNAEAQLERDLAQKENRKLKTEQALAELKALLRLPTLPRRLEAFDVSNIRGKVAVGSMVVLMDGEPAKSMYRRFKIKTVEGQDDFAMMNEIVKRRYSRLKEEVSQKKAGSSLPDLVLVDGGKGQLNAALEAQGEVGVSVPTIGLAKEFEDVYVPYQPNPVDIPKDSKPMLILKRARDEAHRFAVAYHRKKMRQKSLSSVLDGVPGIGPTRKKILLQKYSSVEELEGLDDHTLSKMLRTSEETARKLKEHIMGLISRN